MSSSYTTLANVKQMYGITGTADDALLSRLILAASGFVDNYTNRPNGLAVATYTEVRSGNGRAQLTPANTPVQSVVSFVMDGIAYNNQLPNGVGVTQIGPFVAFDENTIILSGQYLSKGVKNVLVTYTAGYPTIPAEIEQATIDLIGLKYKLRNKIGLVQEALTGIGTVTYLVKDIPADIKMVLDSYKRVAYVVDY